MFDITNYVRRNAVMGGLARSRMSGRFCPQRFLATGPYLTMLAWGRSSLIALLLFTALFVWSLNGAAGGISPDPDRDWWTRISQNLIAYEYVPSNNAHGLQAPNRAHNLRTYFKPDGIHVHDRTTADSPTLVSLSVAGLGRGTALAPVSPGVVRQQADRVEIIRPGLVEWYENSAQGLEQGFTLPERLQGEGPLVLALAVAEATARLQGQSVELTTTAGRRLNYGKLKTIDANGRVLISRFVVPSPDRVHLVVDDSGARYPLVIDPLLTAVPDTIIESNDPDLGSFDSSTFGGEVNSAGDVNGDGFGDIIVGARGWDNGLFDEGAAFVFLGSATGIVGSDPSVANAMIMGDQAASEFGSSVAGAGDVNGDGFGDIVVGAPFYEGTFRGDITLSVKGAAFVFYGGPLGISATSPAMADARIDANQIDSILGFSVAAAGDVNGDTFDDIIVGAPRQGSPTFSADIPPNQAQGFGGAAAVFHGSVAGITASGFDDADAVLLPYPAGSPAPSQQFMGTDVAGAGDVNGDGFDDVLVSIDGAALFLGSATGVVGTDPGTAHAHIAGPGSVVSSAGDVNNDGFGDIILGAPGFPVPEPGFSPTNEGAFGIFLGSPAGIIAADFSQALSIVQGDIGQAQLGLRVSAGDIDNDGFDDVIVGALGFAGSLLREGAAYVFRGGQSGIVASNLSDAFVRLQSNQSEAVRRLNRYELDVAGLGDVNNDGFADVALGLGFFDAGELNEGAVFVYYGGPASTNPNQPPVALAGADQVVVDTNNTGTATFTVDGSLSFDPDGTIVAYAWREGTTLLGLNPVLTTTLPSTGLHTLVLTVTDDGGLSWGDAVNVQINPAVALSPTIDTYTVLPAAITAGESASLSWTTAGATSVSIDNGVGSVAITGNVTVSPVVTTTYTLTATGSGGTVTSSQTVTVQSVSASAETITITNLEFRADRNEWRIAGTSSIPGPGNTMTVYVGPTVSGSPVLGTANVDNLGNWSFRQRDSSISPDSSGMISIQSSQGGTWEGISGVGPAPGSSPPPPNVPSVDSFSSTPALITVGGSSTLAWTTTGASSVSISGVGTGLVADGSVTVSPVATATYTLTATGSGGTVNSRVTVTVSPAPPPPSSAQGVVTVVGPLSVNRGQQASFTVTLTNTGTTTMSGVELTFGISPNRRIRNISPGSPSAVADIPAGGSVSQVWQGQADKEGVATATAAALVGGNLVDSATHTFTVTK